MSDSLRIAKDHGSKFVIHRVEPKETLYSISRRYSVAIDDIYKHNPEIEEGLQMYTELKIPLKVSKNKKSAKQQNSNTNQYHIVETGETLYSISRKNNLSLDELKLLNNLTNNSIKLGDTLLLEDKSNKTTNTPELMSNADVTIENTSQPDSNTHTVKTSETLYSIAKAHNIPLDSLKKWNHLNSNALSIGQVLVMLKNEIKDSGTKPSPVFINEDKKDSVMVEEKPKLDTIYLKTEKSKFHTQKNETDKGTEITEQGFAMKIEGTDFTTKYLALHKTAPMGTKVEITNQMTGKKIAVQVVGQLPHTALNQNLLMRLSNAAFKQLGAINRKIPVTSSYIDD
ncbi:LysM peptidoglycan-binding domain-containing protein [Reichenbachiella versicolor]|uniref:LysM peptidoglycan-binding domain-containing protein n=1 Tax=Reichenbachiella versicolor TaxID=1821036 RepID=UPI0013A562BC|nr:LysM peptidoglycan-binding domain-containing protein [Reichenbachiella versicolor]